MATPLFPEKVHDSETERYLDQAAREHTNTLALLKEYPADELDLQPGPKSPTARELAYKFASEQGLILKALTTGFDWSNPGKPPAPPRTLPEIIDAIENGYAKATEAMRGTSQDDLRTKTARFFIGPGKLGDVPLMDFLWMVLFDQIHHRGQLSVYLRIAGARVPAIYGPSGDESWR
jgi:uncharacterized damage-inducible protein DinB